MDAKNQLSIFCLCLLLGFVGGVFYEFFALFRLIFKCEQGKNKILGLALDLSFFILYAFFCVFASYLFGFGDFRASRWLGFAVGGWLYAKTLRRIVAFLENLCYNMLHRRIKSQKARKKLSNSGG